MKKAIAIAISFSALLFGVYLQNGSHDAIAAESKADINGWWILHEYHDRIVNNRAIGEFSFEEPVYSAIIFKISSDSVFTAGSLLPDKRYARNDHGDTLLRLGHFQEMPLVYNPQKRELTVTFTGSDSGKHTFHYRRLRSNEHVAITTGLFEGVVKNVNGIPVNNAWALYRNYDSFFRAQFFSGTFTDMNGKSFTINSKGEVKGFDKWNTCSVDNFFGTTHWLGKRDRVRFEDSTNTRNFQDYNWRYRGDTLILRKFVGPDIELYKMSKEEERYVRTP